MPDLTIEYHRMCETLSRPFIGHIGGYEQHFDPRYDAEYTCTCPAYTFSKRNNKTCKHVREAESQRCHWHSCYSEEPIAPNDKCPLCGANTVVVRVAV